MDAKTQTVTNSKGCEFKLHTVDIADLKIGDVFAFDVRSGGWNTPGFADSADWHRLVVREELCGGYQLIIESELFPDLEPFPSRYGYGEKVIVRDVGFDRACTPGTYEFAVAHGVSEL